MLLDCPGLATQQKAVRHGSQCVPSYSGSGTPRTIEFQHVHQARLRFRGDGAIYLSARFRNLPSTQQRRHWTAERTLERSIQSGQHFFLTLKPLPHAATRVKQLATLGPNVFADFVTRIPTEVTTCKGSNECDCWCIQMETFLVTPSGRQGYRRKRSCNVARIWERCHILHR